MSRFHVGQNVIWHQRSKNVTAVVVEIPEDNDQRGTVIVQRPGGRKTEVSEFWLKAQDK